MLAGGGPELRLTRGDRRLPAALAERARAFDPAKTFPVRPRAAATVVLLRDGLAGPEAYLLRRVSTMAFAGGMHAFAGGGVDPRDAQSATGWAGPSPDEWARTLDTDAETARGLVCAAVRETFEESGVLLAGATERHVVPDTTSPDWEADRVALAVHTLEFGDLLARRGLVLRTDLLHAWARWVTPEFEPRRYDAYIFVAALPGGQLTRCVAGEADHVSWVRPADAVAAFRSGRMPMLLPTVATLLALSPAGTVAAALALAADRSMAPLVPRPVLADDGVYLALPGEKGYGA